MPSRLTSALVGSLGATGALTIAISAQQAPVFRGTTDLVQVDAVVVDAQGKAVRGLTRDDFELYDRGQRRDIALFEAVSHERAEPPPAGSLLRQDVADNYTARSDRLVILVIDDLHFQGKTAEVQAIARRVVTELGGRATLGLVTTSGSFGVEATEDRSLLLDVIDKFVDKFDPEGRRLDRGVGYIPRDPPGFFPNGPPDLARFFGDMTQYRVLQDVARMIGSEDRRRKAFVWVSGGGIAIKGDLGMGSGSPRDFYAGAQAGLIEALRRANVASYAVHTGDFTPALLRVVADASGGFVADSKHLETGLRQIVSELDYYYLLGFYPESIGKGTKQEYRPLEVRVNRPGLVVRSKQGYQTGPRPSAPRNADPLVALSAGVLPKTDLPLRLFAAQAFDGSRTSVTIALEVSVDAALVQVPGGSFQDSLQFSLLAVDRLKKKVTRRITRETRVHLRRSSESRAGHVVRYQVLDRIDLPPGSYQLRVSATSAAQKRGGSVYSMIDVADPAKSALVLGGLALAASGHHPISTQSIVSVLPFAPVLERVFDRSSQLRVYCDVFRRDTRRPLTAIVTLSDEHGIVKLEEAGTIAPIAGKPLDLSLSLAAQAPGPYRLRAMVTDGENHAERQVGIVVR